METNMKHLLSILLLVCSFALMGQTSVPLYELITASGTDTYTATKTPTPSLTNGLKLMVKFTNANTGASTFNLNSLGGITLRKSDGTALSSGDIPAGSDWWVVYDGTASQFRLVGGAGGGGGTVTSVGFTGGLISVGTPTTTPALTVAGTSGGVPYFSSSSTWATSAALAANALVIGGGAGSAPSTTTTGTGVLTALGVNTGSAGAFVVNGGTLGTPSSGTLTNATGLPVGGISGLGTGVATWLATPSWDNFNSAITGTSTYWSLATTSQTLTGNLAFAGSSSNQLAFNFSTLGANSGVSINSTATDAASSTQRTLAVSQSGANGTASQTTAAGYFSNTKTGTGAINYGIHAVASGGSTNYSGYFDGTVNVTGASLINYSNAGNFQFPNAQSAALNFTDGTDNILTLNTTSNRVEINYPLYVTSSTGTSGQPLLSAGSAAAPTFGTLSVAGGGTGAVTLTGLLQGNGTSAITAITNSSTVGQVIRVTGASTYAWGALDLADTDAVTGALPSANGGTGVSNATQTYTPTLTNSANIDASTPRQCTYFRVGNAVTVSGQVDLDPTTTLTLTTLGISLPIASALTTAFQCGGSGGSIAVSDNAVGIQADSTNDRATLQYICVDVTNHTITFQFTYQVL